MRICPFPLAVVWCWGLLVRGPIAAHSEHLGA